MTTIATDMVVGIEDFLNPEVLEQIAAAFHPDYCETAKEDENASDC